MRLPHILRVVSLVLLATIASLHIASADPIRIVTYNIEADINGFTTPRPGMDIVLQGIGNEIVNGLARHVDVVTLQETTSNTTTVDPIVTILNNLYAPVIYARSPYQGTQSGSNGSGNGPNAIVYNTASLQLISSVGVGTPSGTGAPRQPVRYQFRPAGGDASLDFFVYVSHMKSGTGASNENRRNIEAQLLRSDETSLPPTARVVYTGDFNWGASTEAAYVTLAAAGQGQGFDPINRPGNWQLNSVFKDILTESATNLRYRDDCQLVTQNVMNDPSGLQYISGSYHTFGVNGSTPVNGNVNSPSNTALPGLPNRSAVLSALTTASDHLPMVADYNILVGQLPAITAQPTDQATCAGGSVAFTVTASGSPAPTFQWRRGTTNLSDGSGISGSTTAMLTISSVVAGEAATDYNCLATNGLGSMDSNNAVLSVFPSGGGDGNADGYLDGNDVQQFINTLLSAGLPSAAYCTFDMNADGVVDVSDIDPFATLMLGS